MRPEEVADAVALARLARRGAITGQAIVVAGGEVMVGMSTPMRCRPCAAHCSDYAARHFGWTASEDGRVATITLDRPEKKNPLTFESYAELRDLFRDACRGGSDVRAIVLTGAGGNFSLGRRRLRDHRAADQAWPCPSCSPSRA